jgi:hypothetical protein
MIYKTSLRFYPRSGIDIIFMKTTGPLLLVSPKEWGDGGPFKQFISPIKLVADHRWVGVN